MDFTWEKNESLDSNLHILTKLISYRYTQEKQRLIIKSATRLLLLYFMVYIFVEIFHKHFISIKMKRFYSLIETSKQLSRTKYDQHKAINRYCICQFSNFILLQCQFPKRIVSLFCLHCYNKTC